MDERYESRVCSDYGMLMMVNSELIRIVTSPGTPGCGNAARLDPRSFALVQAAGGQYICCNKEPATFFMAGVIREAYIDGGGKALMKTDRYTQEKSFHGVRLAPLAYEFNRNISFVFQVTEDASESG